MKGKVIAATVAVAVIAIIWLATGSPEPSSRSGLHAPVTADRSDDVARRVEQLSDQRGADHDGWSAGASGQMRVSKSVRPGFSRRKPSLEKPEEAEEQVDSADEVENPQAEFESLKYTALNAQDPDERMDALSSLSTLDDQPVVPVLVKALSDRDPEVRLAALHELDLATDEPPLDALEFALSDSEPEVRLEALNMIGQSDDGHAKFLVQRALRDPDEDVRREAGYIAGVDADDEDS